MEGAVGIEVTDEPSPGREISNFVSFPARGGAEDPRNEVDAAMAEDWAMCAALHKTEGRSTVRG